jgi:(2R)-3-sulfolactate dehydrogenase (NADP+)
MPLKSINDLTALAAAALKAHGASDAMARTTAKYLVAANVQGLATHGVMRVPSYCGHLDAGRAVGTAEPKIIREKSAACLIDAGNGLGFEACELAVQQAVGRARSQGTGYAGVTNSHHCGALGILLQPVAAAGMVGLAFSNASAAIMPWGGTRPLFGTNPVAAIFGRRDAPPIVVDLSLTQVTRGQIMLLAKEGKPIPEGWGMDKDGNPTTEAQKILVGGSLYAVGGLKGTMLALAVELLCCALTGAALSHEVASMHTNEGPPLRLGQSFIAIDPGALAGSEVYFERVETLVEAILADEGVRLPGDRRHALALRAECDGVEIDADLEQQLQTLARIGA